MAAAFLGFGIPAAAADFQASFFGENPNQPYEISPEVSDHQESWARQQGENPTDSIEPAVNPVYERGSTASRRNEQWDKFPETVRAGQAAHAPWPLPERDAKRPAKVWPGIRRITPRAEIEVEEAEDLRDAPAALNARAYSLWSGLSQPMMLPAHQIDSVSVSQARTLGRIDYENKILGAGIGADGAVAAPEMKPRTFTPKGMRAVILELDLENSPGDAWAVLRTLPASAFKRDPSAAAEYYGEKKTRVSIRGFVPAGQSALLLRSDKVLRVQTHRSNKPPAEFGVPAETEILIGVRIPSEVSPNEIVRTTLRRLGRRTGFRFKKALAYQKIPGTDKLAVVISGSVSVESLSLVMADPSVVKVMPAPKKMPMVRRAKKPQRSPNAKLASFFINDNPTYLPVMLIGAWLLLQLASRKRRKRRRMSAFR